MQSFRFSDFVSRVLQLMAGNVRMPDFCSDDVKFIENFVKFADNLESS